MMEKEEILKIVKEYIKENLTITIQTRSDNFYSRGLDTVEVSLYLQGELIIQDAASL